MERALGRDRVLAMVDPGMGGMEPEARGGRVARIVVGFGDAGGARAAAIAQGNSDRGP